MFVSLCPAMLRGVHGMVLRGVYGMVRLRR